MQLLCCGSHAGSMRLQFWINPQRFHQQWTITPPPPMLHGGRPSILVFCIVPDWASLFKVMLDCCFSLCSWLVLAIIWFLTVVYRAIWLSSFLQTWLLHSKTDGPNPIKARNSTNESWQATPVKWKPLQVTTSWSSLRED